MRVLFVCRMFDRVAGGVERMAIALMNDLVERGHDVSLFTWDRANAQPYYPMASAIRWHRLDMGDPSRTANAASRYLRMRRFRSLARAERPDAVVGFQHGPFLFAALSLVRTGIPVVLSERNAPDQLDHTRAGRHRRAIFVTMRLARAITVQFEGYVQRYPAFLQARIVPIANPVYAAKAFAVPNADKAQRVLLSVGRLSYQKNYSALVRAFALLVPSFPDWQLRIVGDGEERAALQSLAESLGIAARVSWPGAVRDVPVEYRAADLFCMPSRWEGFPNAVAEAMAHGLPVVGFRHCAGMAELITPGHNGELADGNGDPPALAAALEPLMRDSAARGRMGIEARRIAEVYRPSKSFDDWENLLSEVARAS
ncbi:MAG: glycosyltransferase family 4 protein [Candidatus Latescibacteria bacterium]|nr:glycosyltransferase family 4 protein [Candidatus Latescibacterota bacterium]